MYYAISKPVTSKSSQSCTTVLFAVETEVSADVGPLQNVALTEECVLTSSRIDHDRVKKSRLQDHPYLSLQSTNGWCDFDVLKMTT